MEMEDRQAMAEMKLQRNEMMSSFVDNSIQLRNMSLREGFRTRESISRSTIHGATNIRQADLDLGLES